MFCFPYPQNAGVDPIRVPLMAQTQYSKAQQESFSAFVDRVAKAELAKIARARTDRQQSTAISSVRWWASLLQSCLFFGVASEVLGRDIKHEEFATNDPDGNGLSIDARIPEWYWRELQHRWKRYAKELSANELEARKALLKKTVMTALVCVAGCEVMTMSLDNDVVAEVLLSVHMLLYIVMCVHSGIEVPQTNTSFASTKLLQRRMMVSGWCEKRLNFLDATPMFVPALYFLSSLRPPRITPENHSSCSREKCLVARELSRPLHRTAECLCKDVAVPIDRLNSIIAFGGIPLVRIARSPQGKIELEVVPYTPSIKYVAISHVWADHQFGSTQNCLPACQVGHLEEVISKLLVNIGRWGLWDWIISFGPSLLGLQSLSRKYEYYFGRRYEYFWLDSFCIPQATQHVELRSRAIDSMNLVYAAASHTLVFDKGLQALDAGQRPASQTYGGCPTYLSLKDNNLLEAVANMYASNWMGRSWTLQEGILSRNMVFPLGGSLAHLKLLSPRHDSNAGGISRSIGITGAIEILKHLLTEPPKDFQQEDPKSLHENMRVQLLTHMKKSLHVEEYADYARSPAGRAARFIKAHILLQSRTTTQVEDIPLILMNMSCMNGNVMSQEKDVAVRMRQLYYGLETLPIELLFSDCTRLGSCEVDSWMPLEIVPETFEGEHTLKLDPEGFIFTTKKGVRPLKFYLLSSPHQLHRFRLMLPNEEEVKSRTYEVVALRESHIDRPAKNTNLWCVVFDNQSPRRCARFVVTRVVRNKYFLHFDCSLRLNELSNTKCPSEAQQVAEHECSAVRLEGKFILERNQEPQYLSISRPQNPAQYSHRLNFIADAIMNLTLLADLYLVRKIWGTEDSMGWLAISLWFLYSSYRRHWIHRFLNSFVHRAWMTTYQPDWNPNGSWKWFWRLSNWESPVPFGTMVKWYLLCVFTLSWHYHIWNVVAIIIFCWLPLYSVQELVNLSVVFIFISPLSRILFRAFQ